MAVGPEKARRQNDVTSKREMDQVGGLRESMQGQAEVVGRRGKDRECAGEFEVLIEWFLVVESQVGSFERLRRQCR